MTDSDRTIADFWEPCSDRRGWEWVSEFCELASDSELQKFEFELFPLARFVLEQLCHNPALRRFTEMLSAQVGKTVTILAYLCWKIVNRPSSVGWYTDTGLNAVGDFKTKILPALEACSKVAPLLPAQRGKKSNTLIQLPYMNLRVMGAESKRNREGKTISEVLCDEARNYPRGGMEQIDNRFKTITNYRRILFSSAGDVMSEPWLSFTRGSRHLGLWPCPKCGHKQTFRFGRQESPLYPQKRERGGFVWDDNPQTHPSEDVYNLAEIGKTIRYECENCGHRFEESEKIGLIRSTEFEQTNPMAAPDDISVHCWEAYMPFRGCSWISIVGKFLNASVAMRGGKIEPMKIFVQETLGEPWEERGVKPESGDIVKRCGEYSIGEEWPPEIETARQITVDMQHGFVRYNYSIFNRAGEKRTVQTGSLASLDEVRSLQLNKKVKDRGVGVDVAHDPSTVYEQCLRYGRWIADPNGGREHVWNGWIPLLGDDAQEFATYVLDKDRNRIAIRSYYKAVVVNAMEGKGRRQPIHRYSWSNPYYKTELYFRRIKGVGPKWEIPKNVDPEYVNQMSVTERVDERNAEGILTGYVWRERGRHDDSDCELMQLVMADINRIVKVS